MVEIKCNKCGRKYAVDEKKIVRRNTRLKCKACENIILVNNLRLQQSQVTQPVASKPKSSVQPQKKKTQVPLQKDPPGVQLKEIFPEFKKEKVRQRLFYRLLISMLFLSILPLVLFLKFSFLQTNKQIRENTDHLMVLITHDLGNRVNHWIDNKIQSLKSITESPAVSSMHHLNQEPVLNKFKNENPFISQILSLRLDGKNTYRVGDNPLTDYSNTPFFKKILKGEALSWQTQFNEVGEDPRLYLAVPITSQNHIVGVMVAIINATDIAATIQNLRKGETGYAFLIDENNRILAHPMEGYHVNTDMSSNPLITAFQNNSSGSNTFQFYDHDTHYIGSVQTINFGWSVAVVQEKKEAFFFLNQAIRSTIFISIITVFTTILIAFIFTKVIIRPVTKLTKSVESIARGELKTNISVSSKDEIGHLYLAVRRMQTSLRMAVIKLTQR